MEKPMRDKDTTIMYQCEIPKCPFMISFNYNSKGYTLCSYELFHTHHLGDSDAFAFRSMIKEIEGYTEFVYQEYFLQRINHQKDSIVFQRPCIILEDLQQKQKLDISKLTSDLKQRIQLKKKFDNVIQILRKRFRKEFPDLLHIEDEFFKNKPGNTCSQTSFPSQIDPEKTKKNILQKKCSLSKTSHLEQQLKLQKSRDNKSFDISSNHILRDSHHSSNFQRKDSTTEPENQLRMETSSRFNDALDSEDATLINMPSGLFTSPTKENSKIHHRFQYPSQLSSHDPLLATQPFSFLQDTQTCQSEILKSNSLPLIKLFPTQIVPEIDSSEKSCLNDHPLDFLKVECQQTSIKEPIISSFTSEYPSSVFPKAILYNNNPLKVNEKSLQKWNYLNWFLLNRGNYL